MTSQTDLDQGGSNRQYQDVYMGPSVGWVTIPVKNVLAVTTGGTINPIVGTTLITLNVAALVTIQLWDPTAPSIPAAVVPGPNVGLPLTIVDIGGNCASFNCTILPASGKTIMGLASIPIASNFGGWVLTPNLTTGNWEQRP